MVLNISMRHCKFHMMLEGRLDEKVNRIEKDKVERMLTEKHPLITKKSMQIK